MTEHNLNPVLAIRQAVTICLRGGLNIRDAQNAFLKELLEQSLAKNHNNQCSLAISEGVHRNTISRMMKHVKLKNPRKLPSTWRQSNGVSRSQSINPDQ